MPDNPAVEDSVGLKRSKSIVKAAAISDISGIIDVLVRAFSKDPVARWVWPDPQQHLIHSASFARAFGGRAFEHGTAYYIDGYLGAALWLPPNVQPDEEAMVAILQNTVSEQIQKDVFAVFEQMGRYHPNEPHWYLPIIGVDPTQQGRGFGSALMQYALTQCDREAKLAYLESSNPKNIPLYERHGFELLGTIQVGTSPSIFPMLRKPKNT
jgi:ribosomal protein S18 acetylase RimI-like enzyme